MTRTIVLGFSGLFFLSTGLLAKDGDNIARCFTENGDIIYSDFYCSTYENDNPHFMTDKSVDKHIRANQLPAISSGTLSSTKLSSVTEEAVSRCTKQFAGYFKRKHRSASEIPPVAFTDVTDQYQNGSKVSISVAAAVQYTVMDNLKTAYIECTAQKLNASTQWQVGFLEK